MGLERWRGWRSTPELRQKADPSLCSGGQSVGQAVVFPCLKRETWGTRFYLISEAESKAKAPRVKPSRMVWSRIAAASSARVSMR